MRRPKSKSRVQAVIGLLLFAAGVAMLWEARRPPAAVEAMQHLIRAYEDRAHG